MPHLIASSITQFADMQSLSSALLFIDVRSAFASVQRSSVITVEDGDEAWALYLVSCGFEAEVAARIIKNTCRIGTLVENGLTEHAVALGAVRSEDALHRHQHR